MNITLVSGSKAKNPDPLKIPLCGGGSGFEPAPGGALETFALQEKPQPSVTDRKEWKAITES